MSVLQLARPDLAAFQPYSSARKEAATNGVLLNANEWPWSPFEGGDGLNRYPQPQPPELLQRLAEIYGVECGQLLVGRGSDEAIDLLIRGFCSAGQDAIVISPPTFGMYRVCAQLQGAAVIEVPLRAERDFVLDVDALIAAAQNNPVKLVFVCSPNNPTGQLADRAQVLKLVDALADRALVIVDEAYVEFADATSLASEVPGRANLAVLRTLSKAYGLAAARIGCLLADAELIGFLRGLMAPYPLPKPSVDAALQALDLAQESLRAVRFLQLQSQRERLHAALAELPEVQHVWPSDANFLCMRVNDSAAMLARLNQAGLIVRDVSRYLGLQNCLRISVGSPEQNDQLLAALVSPASTSRAQNRDAAIRESV